MALTSMTGFARAQGEVDGATFQVEARCVNGRSSDIKLRLPSGMDALEKPIRIAFQKVVRRGNANVSVTMQRETSRIPMINEQVLSDLFSQLSAHAGKLGQPAPSLESVLSMPGVVDMVDPSGAQGNDEAAEAKNQLLQAAVLETATQCASQLASARQSEGAAMHAVLADLVDQIAQETEGLAALDEAKGEHLVKRFQAQLDNLLSEQSDLDSVRLHQEVAILATKADIEEELARLRAHCQSARSLMSEDAAVGRKLDFLAQELNREANTVCSKASALSITQKGLALKALIDQFKEQVQNIE